MRHVGCAVWEWIVQGKCGLLVWVGDLCGCGMWVWYVGVVYGVVGECWVSSGWVRYVGVVCECGCQGGCAM